MDPDGMVVDEYFNYQGHHSGKDEATTDNTKILDLKVWDKNKTKAQDGKESIENSVGIEISKSVSKSDITAEATLNIVEHYNPTDLSVKNNPDVSALQFYSDGKSTPRINANVSKMKNTGYLNNSSVIKNLFSHEAKQYSI